MAKIKAYARMHPTTNLLRPLLGDLLAAGLDVMPNAFRHQAHSDIRQADVIIMDECPFADATENLIERTRRDHPNIGLVVVTNGEVNEAYAESFGAILIAPETCKDKQELWATIAHAINNAKKKKRAAA